MMKNASLALILSAFAATAAAGPVLAQQTADDRKWIAQCLEDNRDEGQTTQVVLAYCTCMNNRMSSNETRSITQWEKANPRASEACGRQAGWRGR